MDTSNIISDKAMNVNAVLGFTSIQRPSIDFPLYSLTYFYSLFS